MIRTLIIDDEKDARFLLRKKLEDNYSDNINVLDEADDIDTGIEAIKKHNPDLVFLDIKMPQGTGFDLLLKLEKVDFEVVFITAYNEYAVKAFQISAFGYLMKPIKSLELDQVVNKIITHHNLIGKEADNRLKVLMDNTSDDQKIKKMIISNTEGFKVIELNDIYYLSGDRNYTHFILANQPKITSPKTLGEYEQLLSDHGFFRIHQGSLVNLGHIKEYLKRDGGSAVMKNGDVLPVSRRRKNEFITKFLK